MARLAALTMIKKALPLAFPSMVQVDRIVGQLTVSCGQFCGNFPVSAGQVVDIRPCGRPYEGASDNRERLVWPEAANSFRLVPSSVGPGAV
jgi:hypothetical protein